MFAIFTALALSATGPAQPKPFFLFRIYDDHHKETLWRTDGTAAGTRLLGRYCRIAPGPMNAETALFVESDCRTETRLWGTDGTRRGGVPLGAILPGELLSIEFGTLGHSVVFYATTYSSARVLWRSDGTVRGTRPARLPSIDEDKVMCGLAEWSGASWFWVLDRSAERQNPRLWKSDGSTEGTVQVVGPSADVNIKCGLVPFKDHMYFTVKHEGLYSQLWRTDGTPAGTTMVRDFGEAIVQGLTVSRDTLYFRRLGRDADEWWRTDGIPGHERVVKRIPTRWDEQDSVSTGVAGGVLYFTAFGKELWKSDGTEGGTVRVKDFRGESHEYGDLELLGEYGGSMYLMLGAPTGLLAKALWKTDGTEKGTVFIKKVGERVSWGKKKRK